MCTGRKNEGTGDTSTGYIKNFAHIQDPLADEPSDQKFMTTYKRINNEREDRIQTTGIIYVHLCSCHLIASNCTEMHA